MSILPILLGLLLFMGNGENKISSLLGSLDINSVLDLCKTFGIGGEVLSNIPPDFINDLINGQIDFKSVIPLAIKFFTQKKEKVSPSPEHYECNMNFMNGEIKTALYNYLKVN